MRTSSDRKVLFFLGGFGFLPLWASVVAVYLDSIQAPAPPEYLTVAPCVVIAAVPFFDITFGIATATLIVHKRMVGHESSKLKFSVLTLLSLCAMSSIAAALLWQKHKTHAQNLRMKT